MWLAPDYVRFMGKRMNAQVVTAVAEPIPAGPCLVPSRLDDRAPGSSWSDQQTLADGGNACLGLAIGCVISLFLWLALLSFYLVIP